MHRDKFKLYKTMLLNCLRCRKIQKVKIQKLQGEKWENNAFIKMCHSKKAEFIKTARS